VIPKNDGKGLPDFGTPSPETIAAIQKVFDDLQEKERKERMKPITGGVVFNTCMRPNCMRSD